MRVIVIRLPHYLLLEQQIPWNPVFHPKPSGLQAHLLFTEKRQRSGGFPRGAEGEEGLPRDPPPPRLCGQDLRWKGINL